MFQAFNAFNFTVALGAPLVLLARMLGAGESAIGLLIALSPFLLILQLTATNYADRWGYRRLMLAGWSTRSFMLLLVVPLPLLLGRFPSWVLVTGLMIPMVLFNLVRGFAAGAWLPWLTQLIPEGSRGRFLGFEQMIINISATLTLLACGWFLGSSPEGWRYSVIFAAAWAGGMVSVMFLRKAPSKMPFSGPPPPRRTVRDVIAALGRAWAHTPLRRTARYAALITFALSAIPGFLILFLRDELQWSEGKIVILQAVSPVGCLLTAVFWGRLSDQAGSRPILRVTLTGLFLLTVFWMLSAFGVLHPRPWAVAAIYLLWGVFGVGHTIPQLRLVLDSCPPDEVTVGMSAYQVLVSIAGGVAPVLWGYLLENLRYLQSAGSGVWLNGFAIFFTLNGALLIGGHFFLGRICESHAVGTRQLLVQMFWEWPLRVLSSFSPDEK
jgi:MFS family permease